MPRPAAIILALGASVLAACDAAPDRLAFQGYVEGEYLRIAAPAAGWLERVGVAEGEGVAAGDLLFALDATGETAAVAEARARLVEAEAHLADLRQGRRPEEIAVIEAQLAAAEAASRYAAAELRRREALARRNVAAPVQVEQARAAAQEAAAGVERAKAELAAARLPARPDRIAAAEAAAEAARAALARAEWQLALRRVSSPAAGLVETVARQPGEWVPANGTVVSLLPPTGLKAVFFVPEPQRAALAPGRIVGLACDGCPPGLSARVSFLAPEAEYTPPVIFSEETRAKLVYRAEAVPLGDAARLLPGQPVTVLPEAPP